MYHLSFLFFFSVFQFSFSFPFSVFLDPDGIPIRRLHRLGNQIILAMGFMILEPSCGPTPPDLLEPQIWTIQKPLAVLLCSLTLSAQWQHIPVSLASEQYTREGIIT